MSVWLDVIWKAEGESQRGKQNGHGSSRTVLVSCERAVSAQVTMSIASSLPACEAGSAVAREGCGSTWCCERNDEVSEDRNRRAKSCGDAHSAGHATPKPIAAARVVPLDAGRQLARLGARQRRAGYRRDHARVTGRECDACGLDDRAAPSLVRDGAVERGSTDARAPRSAKSLTSPRPREAPAADAHVAGVVP